MAVKFGSDSVHHHLLHLVIEELYAMFDEEKKQFQSLLKRHQSEILPTESPCLVILRENIIDDLDDEELQFLNFDKLNEELSAFEKTIRRSRMVSYLRKENTYLVLSNDDLTTPMHEFEVYQGECCSTSSLVDQKNVTSSRLSIVSYLTSIHFTHRDCSVQKRREENLRRFSSSLATLTFPLLLFSTVFSNPFQRLQGSHSLLLALFALFNFMAFATASSVMILVRARFTQTQIIMLLISTMALNIWSSNFLILTLLSIPALAILCAVWCLDTNSSPR